MTTNRTGYGVMESRDKSTLARSTTDSARNAREEMRTRTLRFLLRNDMMDLAEYLGLAPPDYVPGTKYNWKEWVSDND